MSYPVTLIQRAVRAIKSCKTIAQLACAARYAKLVTKAYRKCAKSDDMWDDFVQACKAEELRMELKQLVKQQLSIIENKC